MDSNFSFAACDVPDRQIYVATYQNFILDMGQSIHPKQANLYYQVQTRMHQGCTVLPLSPVSRPCQKRSVVILGSRVSVTVSSLPRAFNTE
jgi:hypothetical protein